MKTLYDWCIENNRKDILLSWDFDKNKDTNPRTVSYGTKTKYHWKCDKGHNYEMSPNDRRRSECPYCQNRKLLVGFNDLKTKNPKLAEDWNYQKNTSLSPQDVMAGSSKKVWWKCSICGHEWQAVISSRNKGRGCPQCSLEKQTSFNEQVIYFYLKQIFPDVINRYNKHGFEIDIFIPSLNLGIEYDGELWHKDSQKDEEKNKLCSSKNICLIRIREVKCPNITNCFSYKLSNNHKDIKNAILFIAKFINEKYNKTFSVDFDLDRDRTQIMEMATTMEKEKSVMALNPLLAKEWNYEKNGKLKPNMFRPNSTKKVWWKCENGHEWSATIASRNFGKNGCPYCSGKKVLKGFNDLATTYPELLTEWDYSTNINISPFEVTKASHKKVFWICSKCGTSYPASIDSKTLSKSKCPVCAGKQVKKGYNDLKTLHPDIAKYWDYSKNELKPDEVQAYKNKKVYWICPICGKSYSCRIADRVIGKNCMCSKCSQNKAKENLRKTKTKGREIAKVNPNLIKQWHPTKNGELTPYNVASGSHLNIWWKCDICGHEWEVSANSRTNNGSGCPKCARKKANESLRKTKTKGKELSKINPELAQEWHPTKNGDLTPDNVAAGSHLKVWWLCPICGNEWECRIDARHYNKKKCPNCKEGI